MEIFIPIIRDDIMTWKTILKQLECPLATQDLEVNTKNRDAAVKNAKDPKTKKRLKAAHTYAEQRKEASKQKTKSRSRGAFTR